MVRYLLGRILGMLVVFIAVSIIAFLLMHSVPGGPFDEEKSPLPPAARANILRKYGLDRPLYEQYLRYMWSALHGDFGTSFQSPTESVIQLIGRTWPVSIQLGGLAILLAFTLGPLFGILAAVKQNTWIDYLVTFMSTLGLTAPSFVVALWLLLLFAVRLRWLPTGGWPNGATGDWKTVIMPTVALSLGPLGIVARYTRSSLVEVIHSDYIRTARAKGLPGRAVVINHALRNSLLPVVTVAGLRMAALLEGSVIVESMFSIPGIGRLAVASISARDYPTLQAIVVVFAVVTVAVNLLVDVLYTVLDPTIKYA